MTHPAMTDVKEAFKILDELVAEKGPDYVDPNVALADGACKYLNPDGTPSCIVGNFFIKVGIPASLIAELAGPESALRVNPGIEPGASSMASAIGGFDYHEVVRHLTTVQMYQDDGRTWYRAVAEAREAARHFGQL